MADRDARIAALLRAGRWSRAARTPLAGDASFRHYERLTDGGRRAVLMDAPPPMEDVRPYVTVARHLLKLGYSAPRVLAQDVRAGLVLIEDLGDDTYTRLLERDGDEEALYTLAVDLLIDLHGRTQAATAVAVPPYDDGRLLDEAVLLVDWYLPAMRGRPSSRAERKGYLEPWQALFPAARRVPETLVLRDYHVDNLMRLKDREGIGACGLLDFQDAVIGPVTYDLMSLLEDARRDVAPELARKMKARYLAAFPELDREAFQTSYAILGAQRHAKVIGIFTRLSVRDGKSAYLAHIPRVWRLLEGALQHPALAPVRDWFGRHVPPSERGVPPRRTAA
ncbi:MAG: phosphotransferase [Proteobacteria bacterium]|nr:phosphotransferase [Pseudomonadota bacterium]